MALSLRDLVGSLTNAVQNIIPHQQVLSPVPQSPQQSVIQRLNIPAQVNAATQYFTNPSSYGGNNLWSSPVAKMASQAQQFNQTSQPLQVPQVQPFGTASLPAKLGNAAVNLAGNVASSIANVAYKPGTDVGNIIGGTLAGKGLPAYGQLKSPEIRLLYNLRGQQATPQQVIGNVAEIGSDALTVAAPKFLTGVGNQAGEQATKQTLLQVLRKGAITGASGGGVLGALQGLASGRNDTTIDTQIQKGAQQGAQGALIGGVTGGAVAAGGYGIGKIADTLKGVYKKFHPEATDAQATKSVKEWARDELGRFTGKQSGNDSPLYTEYRKSLGLPPNGNYNTGAIDLNAQIGGQDLSKLSPEELKGLVKAGKITIGQYQQALQAPDLSAFENAINAGDKETAQKIAAQHPGDVRYQISQEVQSAVNGTPLKERGFITHVKEAANTPDPLKALVEGTYVVKSNNQLKSDALKLIQSDPQTAIQLATNPQNDTHVQIGNELINYYASQGDTATAKRIAEGMAQSGTDFGRAVQAFSQYDKTTPSGAIRFAQQKINEYNKLNPQNKLDITSDQVQSLFDKAHTIQNMQQGRERNVAANELMNEINNMIPSTLADKAIAVWKAGLLTSLRTHERNLLGNSIQGGAEVAKDIPATVADKLMALRTGQRTVTPTLQGIGSGAAKGLQATKDIIQMGYDPEESIAKYDVRHITWGNNPVEQALKKYTDVVFRTLGGEDKPFWNAAFARSLYDQAGAQAINTGQQADKTVIENLVKNPTEQMLITATKDANVATFHDVNKLGKVADTMKQTLGNTQAGKIISEVLAPFTGVPTSIAGNIVNYSPIGLLKGIAKAGVVVAKNVPDLQRQAAQEIGRGVIGSGLFGIGAYLASKGLLTGQPKDTKEAQQWQLEGKPANSVLLGGKWRNINSVGPQNLIMLAGAKAAEELKKGTDASIGTYGAGIGKDFLSQTFLQGIQQPLSALTDPNRYGQSYLGNQASSIVPNIVKDTSKAFDPMVRENNSIQDYLTNALPGFRNLNTPRRDVLGNIIPQEPSGVNAFVDLFNSKSPINNTLVQELGRLNEVGQNATPSKLNKSQTINGIKQQLTPKQLDILESNVGPQVVNALNGLIQSTQYQTLSDEDKKNAIDTLVSQVRKQVRGTIDLPSSPSSQTPTVLGSSSSNTSSSPLRSVSSQGKQILVNPDTGAVNQYDLSKPKEADAYYKQQFLFSGQNQAQLNGKYYFLTDTGNAQVVDPSFQPTEPSLTGNSELDKLAISKFKGEIAQKKNDIYTLYKNGVISDKEAEQQLQTLLNQVNGFGKPKRVRIASIKTVKAKIMKLATSKPPSLKVPKTSTFKLKGYKKPKLSLKSTKKASTV